MGVTTLYCTEKINFREDPEVGMRQQRKPEPLNTNTVVRWEEQGENALLLPKVKVDAQDGEDNVDVREDWEGSYKAMWDKGADMTMRLVVTSEQERKTEDSLQL